MNSENKKQNVQRVPFAVLDTFKNALTYFTRVSPDIRVAQYAAAFDSCAERIENTRAEITDTRSLRSVDLARGASVELSSFIDALASGNEFSDEEEGALDRAYECIADWARLRPSIFGRAKCSPDDVASLAISVNVLRAALLNGICDFTDLNIARIATERAECEEQAEKLRSLVATHKAVADEKKKIAQMYADHSEEERGACNKSSDLPDDIIVRYAVNLNTERVQRMIDSTSAAVDAANETTTLISLELALSQLEAELSELNAKSELYLAIESFTADAFVKGTPAYSVPMDDLILFAAKIKGLGEVPTSSVQLLSACEPISRVLNYYARENKRQTDNI